MKIDKKAGALRLMGELAALSEPPAVGEAEGYYAQALSLAEELEMRPLQARTHLGRKGYDPTYGARPLSRLIQTEVRDPLTDEILFGQLEHGGTVTIGLAGEALTFSCEPATAAPEPAPEPAEHEPVG